MKYYYELKSGVEIRERGNLNFPPHLHEQFEIGYIEEGSVVLIIDEKLFKLKKGDFFMVFPNQIHSYEESKNLKAKLVIFHPNFISDYKQGYSSKIPQNPIIENNDTEEKILMLLFDMKMNNMNVIKGLLIALFGALTDKVKLIDMDKYNVSTLKNLLMYCSEHFSEGITISDVSQNLHISRHHIAHIFRNKLNTTFTEYITDKRIEYACALLCDESLTVTDVAYQSGFNSLRTFNRNFSKVMNLSPKEYRKRK